MPDTVHRACQPNGCETHTFLAEPAFWALTLSYVLSQFFRSYIAVISTQIIADFGFSPQMFGWFAGAFFLVFAVAQLPVGWAFDRFGVGRPTALLMAAGALCVGLLSFTTDPWIAIIAQAGIGLGCAPVFMGLLNHVLSAGAGARQVRAVTVASAIGMSGALLAAWPLSRASALMGWRSVMLMAAFGMAAATLCVAWFVKTAARPQERAQGGPMQRASRETGARFWTLLPACLAMSVGATFRTSWGGPYLADTFGFDLIHRGNAMTITSLVGAGASFSIPLLVRFWSSKRIALVWLIAGAASASALALVPNASSTVGVAFICVLFSVGSIHPLVMSQARGIVPSRLLGRALGLLNSLVFLGIAISSSCFGWIAGGARLKHDPPAHVYGLLFAFTAFPLAIAAVVYIFSPRGVSHDTHA